MCSLTNEEILAAIQAAEAKKVEEEKFDSIEDLISELQSRVSGTPAEGEHDHEMHSPPGKDIPVDDGGDSGDS